MVHKTLFIIFNISRILLHFWISFGQNLLLIYVFCLYSKTATVSFRRFQGRHPSPTICGSLRTSEHIFHRRWRATWNTDDTRTCRRCTVRYSSSESTRCTASSYHPVDEDSRPALEGLRSRRRGWTILAAPPPGNRLLTPPELLVSRRFWWNTANTNAINTAITIVAKYKRIPSVLQHAPVKPQVKHRRPSTVERHRDRNGKASEYWVSCLFVN